MPNINKLIDQLDENRDYGSRTYEQVVEDVENGVLVIQPGYDHPVLSDLKGGVVKGSGRAKKQQAVSDFTSAVRRLKELEGNRDWFENTMKNPYKGRMVKTGDKNLREWFVEQAVESIMEKQNGSIKLLQFFLEQHIGKPKETSMGGIDALAKAMTEMLSGEGDIPVNTGDVIEGEYTVE